MKRSIRIAGVCAGSLAVVAGLWLRLAPRHAEPRVVARAALAPVKVVAGPAAKVAAEPREGCHFEVGQKLAYGLQLRTRTLDPSLLGASAPPVSLELEAQLQLQVEQVEPHRAVMVARLARLTSSGGLETSSVESPFLVSVDETCRLSGFARQRGTPRWAGRNQQALLWEAQFQATPSAHFELQNGNGVAVGRLERTGPGELRRTLESYASMWRDPAAKGVPTDGVMLVHRVGDGWFENLDAAETLGVGGSRVDSRLSLSKTEPREMDFGAGARDLSGYVWENLLPYRNPDLVHRPVSSFDLERQRRVAGLTPTQAVDQFLQRVQKRVGVQDTWPDLAAYFEVHPDAVGQAVRRYRNGEVPAEAAGDFFLALEKARVSQAQQALLSIKRDANGSAMDRVRAMFALAGREDVGAPLASELATDVDRQIASRGDQTRFLGGEAMLALAMMSGDRDDPDVTRIAEASVQGLLAHPPEKLQALRATMGAVGNIGDPALLGSVRPFTSAADPDVRRAAAKAFGRMPPEEATPLALEWLRRESDPLVKRDLYDVLQQEHQNLGRPASLALASQAISDLPTMKTAFARRALVRLIATSEAAQTPEIRRALVAQAKWERAHHSPLLNEFQSILTPAEVGEVLR